MPSGMFLLFLMLCVCFFLKVFVHCGPWVTIGTEKYQMHSSFSCMGQNINKLHIDDPNQIVWY